jgi:hypothetical protein
MGWSIDGALSLKQGNAQIKWEGVPIQFSKNEQTGTQIQLNLLCTYYTFVPMHAIFLFQNNQYI